jgi:hypothetical protein
MVFKIPILPIIPVNTTNNDIEQKDDILTNPKEIGIGF